MYGEVLLWQKDPLGIQKVAYFVRNCVGMERLKVRKIV